MNYITSHHFLNRSIGALQIPIGTYHRSISNKKGSNYLLEKPITIENHNFHMDDIIPLRVQRNDYTNACLFKRLNDQSGK
tara:strand:+ start:567 stop:806 length:240 start_codon:yes stop_codon:yes gene_type:complete